ncbi:MAG: glutamate synthase [Candidatus Omnitrophica bacterium CG1_02_49_10]|nr:MAG: glutamate synthase [Candidatus Omnitrophica bacterium CG1_02_49_10]
MGDIKGFLNVKRQPAQYRQVCDRVKDFREVVVHRSVAHSMEQASRCMDCGTPFCNWGCPVGNYIPEWNDLVYHGHWHEAFRLLDATNNLPEITGRVCPATCEYACVLGINDDPVTIREDELAIVEHAFKNGWVKPNPPKKRTGKSVAVIGSGPAGLASAQQLNRAGHKVTVFERDYKMGGILRYGIPEFKLEKKVIDRRLDILKKEGIVFRTNVDVGVDYKAAKLKSDFDAVCLTCGSRVPRDLKIEGRELNGIHFAMDYLIQANKRAIGEKISESELIDAKGKRVVVIGGGDTGADCVGTAHRQGASCVVQIEVMPQPSECRTDQHPWPKYPMILKTSTSHEEGGERHWAILTKRFIGDNGRLTKLACVRVDFSQKDERSCPVMREIPSSGLEIEADLAILAVGFVHPEHSGLLYELKVKFDDRGNVAAGDDYMTNIKGVFTAGDMHTGQSLVVRAIADGRRAAHHIDKYLMGNTHLPVI